MHLLRGITHPLTMIGATFFLVLIDRALKVYMYMHPFTDVHIISNILHLRYTLNTGAVFSLPVPLWIVIALTVVVFIFFVWYWLRYTQRSASVEQWAGVCIIVGAASNLYDRIQYHGVIDMLTVPGLGACNLADLYVVIGACLLVGSAYFVDRTA